MRFITTKSVLFIVGIILGLYIIFMGAYYATSFPSFCSTCHEIKPIYVSWKNSPHQAINCLHCHEQRGAFGKIDSKARGINYVYQHFTGQYSSMIAQAEVFEQNCIDCHNNGYRQFPDAPVLNNAHYDFIKTGRQCVECHRETGHEKAIIPGK